MRYPEANAKSLNSRRRKPNPPAPVPQKVEQPAVQPLSAANVHVDASPVAYTYNDYMTVSGSLDANVTASLWVSDQEGFR